MPLPLLRAKPVAWTTQVETLCQQIDINMSSLKAMSVLWTKFGFSEDGIQHKIVQSKHCTKTVSAAKGNTNNFLIF